VPSGPRARPFNLGMPQEEVSFRTMPATEAQQPSLETPFFEIALLARRLPVRPGPRRRSREERKQSAIVADLSTSLESLHGKLQAPGGRRENSGVLSAH